MHNTTPPSPSTTATPKSGPRLGPQPAAALTVEQRLARIYRYLLTQPKATAGK